MKKIFFLLTGIMVLISVGILAGNPVNILVTSLSGKITDKNTGEALPGVSIYFPDLKTGTITKPDGTYFIENLPATNLLIHVSYIGYKQITVNLDLSLITHQDFQMEVSITELNELVITGLSRAAERNRTPTPIAIIPPTLLLQNTSGNIIDAIARMPGISQLTTGSGISKPVIRGLGYNRVVTVNDGIRQEGQQWGDEHGIEIDEFSVGKVEILKGPASLAYGSDAMAGVINFLTNPGLPEGTINGNVLLNYQTNNGLVAGSVNLEGNKNGWIWDGRYSQKQAHAFSNAYDGYVLNSGFKEQSAGLLFGINRSWGYSHLHLDYYSMKPGIVEGERDSATGKFIYPLALNDSTVTDIIASDADLKSYTQGIPYQKIHHYKVVLNNSILIRNGNLKVIAGWQQNQRQEFGDVLNPDQYGLYFLLNSLHYDIRYLMPEKRNMQMSFGINGMSQQSQNKGLEFLVPEYNLFDFGLFFLARKNYKTIDLSGGLRYDIRTQQGEALFLDAEGAVIENPGIGSVQKFKAFDADFKGISGSLGGAWQISEILFAKVNISRGFRAPNIAEAGANGVHEGTIRYEIGDAELKAENSLQTDVAFGVNSEHVSAELDIFQNAISGFIFPRKLESRNGGDSLTDGVSTFKFVSGDAVLTGGEVSLDFHPHPLDWLHVENSFSYVLAQQKNQPDSTQLLPLTPAARLTNELKATRKKWGNSLANTYVKIEVDTYFKQDKIYSAYGTETATPAYTLINAGFGGDLLRKGKPVFSMYFSINNLTDKTYQNHLSRLKYGAVNNVSGRTGVYNMGRNFSVKLLIPVTFSKKA